MEVLGLHPRLSLWLIAANEEPGLLWSGEGSALSPSSRYLQAASAQKIFYDPLSITQDLKLEAAFQSLGSSIPTVDQAHATYRLIEDQVPGYAFEADRDVWYIRNQSKPTFREPLIRERWVLFARTDESATRRVELDGAEVAEALSWLPLLDGHHTIKEVEAAVARSPAATRVLGAFNEIGAFFIAMEEELHLEELPELLFVSHSSVFVRGREASILIDPAILSATEELSKKGRRPFELAARASAVLISHCHWDHFAFQTMLRIPRETRIFVPRSTHPALVNPPMRPVLEAFGFRDVVEVSDWDEVTIGDIQVTFVPFFGEPFGLDSRFDAFTYLVRANGRTIYGSLDACHDEAGDMNEVFRKLGEDHEVDVFLFGSSNQRHEPLYRAANMRHYSNELIVRPDLVRYHPNVDDVVRWCGSLRPQSLIPYANFVYFGAEHDDEELGASNVDRYWAALEGHGGALRPAYQTWRTEMEHLARSVTAPVMMLHPMQGLRLG